MINVKCAGDQNFIDKLCDHITLDFLKFACNLCKTQQKKQQEQEFQKELSVKHRYPRLKSIKEESLSEELDPSIKKLNDITGKIHLTRKDNEVYK